MIADSPRPPQQSSQTSPKPSQPAHQAAPPTPQAQAAKPSAEPTPIGAVPKDAHDPQAAKFKSEKAPPRWDEPKAAKAPEDKPLKPALDPRKANPPPLAGENLDGVTVANEQRLRSAFIEAEGMEKYFEAVDERPKDERPDFRKNMIGLGGAYVAKAHQAQTAVAGVDAPRQGARP